jgi:hypothetical protein
MRASLVTKLILSTVGAMAVTMADLGAVMAHLLALDVRQRAAREDEEKTTEILSGLQIVDARSSQNVRSALNVMVHEGQRLGAPESKGIVQLAGKSVPDLRPTIAAMLRHRACCRKNLTGDEEFNIRIAGLRECASLL